SCKRLILSYLGLCGIFGGIHLGETRIGNRSLVAFAVRLDGFAVRLRLNLRFFVLLGLCIRCLLLCLWFAWSLFRWLCWRGLRSRRFDCRRNGGIGPMRRGRRSNGSTLYLWCCGRGSIRAGFAIHGYKFL